MDLRSLETAQGFPLSGLFSPSFWEVDCSDSRPTFAVIYYIIQSIVNRRLEKKDLPVQSDYYDELSYVDDEGTYIHRDKAPRDDREAEEKTGPDKP